MNEKWDIRFLSLAEHVASWSKDPSTQTGAAIIRPDKTLSSVGYNGFPRGIEDDPKLLDDREAKYKRVIHAELNAILNAGESVRGCTLYIWPWLSCSRCAVHVIQSGIARVVCPGISRLSKERLARWIDDFVLAEDLYKEAGVELHYYDA